MAAAHAFGMYEQSSTTEIKAMEEQLETCKKRASKASETKAVAEGEIETVKNALADSQKYMKDTQSECMEKASEWETESAERSEELTVLAQAKKILSAQGVDSAEGRLSEVQMFPPSFVQVRAATGSTSLPIDRQVAAAHFLEQEGMRLQNSVLAQVGSRVASDPFAKVKEMIQGMVDKLLQEQAEESTHKAWCDEELGKTAASLDTKGDRVDELNTRLDKAKADSAKLAQEVAVLLEEVQALDIASKEATAMRQKGSADFKVRQQDYQTGQQACAAAIKVLRQYYEGSFVQKDSQVSITVAMQTKSQEKEKNPSGIIGLLEVAESDFSRMLAEAVAAEDAAASEFDTFSGDSKVSRASKETEQKNKAAARQRLDTGIAEISQDREDSQTELAAVKEYDEKLASSCETKAPAFEEREARRKNEVEGLQTALGILDGKDLALEQFAAVTSGYSGLRR